jgi:hypothetical protein
MEESYKRKVQRSRLYGAERGRGGGMDQKRERESSLES